MIGHVSVRVTPSISWIGRRTRLPSSSMLSASARTTTSCGPVTTLTADDARQVGHQPRDLGVGPDLHLEQDECLHRLTLQPRSSPPARTPMPVGVNRWHLIGREWVSVPEVETSESPEGSPSGRAGEVGEPNGSGREVVDYRTLIEQIPAITYTEVHGGVGQRTTYVSPQATHILGYTPQQFIEDRQLWRTLRHPADRAYGGGGRAHRRDHEAAVPRRVPHARPRRGASTGSATTPSSSRPTGARSGRA